MKELLNKLDKAFDNKHRMAIMSILMVEDSIDYKDLKTSLDITDGNLATHIKKLEAAGYIAVIKSFIGKRPNTKYSISKLGITAFKNHINYLEKMIKSFK